MPRLFFALRPQLPQRAAIQAATAPLARRLGGRPVPADDLHLTLCFLGQVPAEDVDALAAAAGRIEPLALDLVIDRIDLWRRSRVLCLLPAPSNALAPVGRLAAELTAACRAIGLAPDDKPFRAHVTVARGLPAQALREQAWPMDLPEPLAFSADGFVLISSGGAGEGPRYQVIHEWKSHRRHRGEP